MMRITTPLHDEVRPDRGKRELFQFALRRLDAGPRRLALMRLVTSSHGYLHRVRACIPSLISQDYRSPISAMLQSPGKGVSFGSLSDGRYLDDFLVSVVQARDCSIQRFGQPLSLGR